MDKILNLIVITISTSIEVAKFIKKVAKQFERYCKERIDKIKIGGAVIMFLWNSFKAFNAFSLLDNIAGTVEILKGLTYITIASIKIRRNVLLCIIIPIGLGDFYVSRIVGYKTLYLLELLLSPEHFIVLATPVFTAMLATYLLYRDIKIRTWSGTLSEHIANTSEATYPVITFAIDRLSLTLTDACILIFAVAFTRFTFGATAWNLVRTPD